MEMSYMLSQVLGPIFLILGVGILLNLSTAKKAFDDFLKNTYALYGAAIAGLVVGLLLVLNHNYWVSSWEVVITIISWIILLKATLFILLPDQMTSVAKKLKKAMSCKFEGAILLLVGLLLTYMGYFVG